MIRKEKWRSWSVLAGAAFLAIGATALGAHFSTAPGEYYSGAIMGLLIASLAWILRG